MAHDKCNRSHGCDNETRECKAVWIYTPPRKNFNQRRQQIYETILQTYRN
jgi:hypothetical protein